MFSCQQLFLLFAFIFPAVTICRVDNRESTMSFPKETKEEQTNSLMAVPYVNQYKYNDKIGPRASAGVSYHEFLINEASYKFWAIFQLVTVAVLLYSTFAAIYYARYNYLMNLESGNYDDLLFARSMISTSQNRFTPLDSQTFQRIVDAIFGIDEHDFGVQLRD